MQVSYDYIAIFNQYLASSHVANAATVRCYQRSAAGPWQVGEVTLIAGSNKRRSLLMTGDGRRSIYDKKHRRYIRRQQNSVRPNCTQ